MSKELTYARELVGSAISAPDHYLDVITLACAATYKTDDLFSAPRILALGEKGSGKSTVLTVATYLARNAGPVTGVLAMTGPSYVADYRMDPRHTPTLDEVNHLFGESGSNGKSSKFYTYLNQGYRRDTAYAQHQENKVALRIPIFGIAFLAGQGLACPPDLRERSIVIKMKKARGDVQVADFSDPGTRASFEYGGRILAAWSKRTGKLKTEDIRGLHPRLNHRTMDVWGPLFMVAREAGDVWLKRCMLAFERIELDAGTPVYAPEDQLMLDYLKFSDLPSEGSREGVQSGVFAEFAIAQDHGAYSGLKPGQFRQFAVKVLGPTQPFYDQEMGKTVRGWADTVHDMNLSAARARVAELEEESQQEAAGEEAAWEDF